MFGKRLRFLTMLMLLALPLTALARQEISLGSGHRVEWIETLVDVQGVAGATARFRFIDRSLRQGDDRFDDMAELCNDFALERSFALQPTPMQIVISLADRDLAFGQVELEAVQLFEAFSVEQGLCQWEPF